MPLVVDSSFMVALLVHEEHSAFARARMKDLAGEPRVAPALVVWEAANVLWRKMRRAEISASERRELLEALQAFQTKLELPTPMTVLALSAFADLHDLTAYDAAYLEMALRLDAPLATLDRPLTYAAKAEGLVVLSPFA
jgi:predicted nucleic acid-binding protein